MGSGMGASAVRVASSTGDTAFGQTTYPSAVCGAGGTESTGADPGAAMVEHPPRVRAHPPSARAHRTPGRRRRPRLVDDDVDRSVRVGSIRRPTLVTTGRRDRPPSARWSGGAQAGRPATRHGDGGQGLVPGGGRDPEGPGAVCRIEDEGAVELVPRLDELAPLGLSLIHISEP